MNLFALVIVKMVKFVPLEGKLKLHEKTQLCAEKCFGLNLVLKRMFCFTPMFEYMKVPFNNKCVLRSFFFPQKVIN